ncbi:antibiotic biosynthesis monooxygenase family protein [Neptunicella marina]|uniref:Antibiotic biosynthesis monooxygenase n=1 Tax=Neptunicella marina TaxID=2125989 RepID=A0A8J6ITF0_9ALTE|nr:antibiotic biosynthesis monooxygenase [Neptunicella marina]MBC3765979.1 antibiotic biosynthesis monooxygenase [Neptunicella marina]
MIAVIFEVTPNETGKDRYFEIAADLKPYLCDMDGFIGMERFESLSNPGRYLSLSFWRDEASVKLWKSHFAHCEAQHEGKNSLFEHYRLRVAHVVRDYGMDGHLQSIKDV